LHRAAPNRVHFVGFHDYLSWHLFTRVVWPALVGLAVFSAALGSRRLFRHAGAGGVGAVIPQAELSGRLFLPAVLFLVGTARELHQKVGSDPPRLETQSAVGTT
jgi:hypothetical protein